MKIKTIALFMLATLATGLAAGQQQMPSFLKKGDKIAIISPGSTPKAPAVDKACEVIESWGYVPVRGSYLLEHHHDYAGTVQQRTTDLLWALRDPSIKAILCTRGGYGSSQLLYEIPLDTIAKYRKWIIGYSDITSLHSAMVRAGGMSIHGNMCGRLSDTGGTDEASQVLRRLLEGKLPHYSFPGHPYNVQGTASGILLGGNMSVFCNIGGSKDYDFLDRDFLEGKDVILFMEDVSESFARVCSMLYQLKLKGVIDHVKGIILGRFTDYTKPASDYDDMNDMLREYLDGYNIPICYDFPASHDEDWNYPLIEGCPVTLSVKDSGVILDFRTGQ